MEEVECVGYGGTGCVVAGENEGLYLVDGCCAEGRVHGLGGGGCFGGRGRLEFFLVRVEGEGDDGAVTRGLEAGLGVVVGVTVGVAVGRVSRPEALVEFLPNEAVELPAVQPYFDGADEVDVFQGVDGRRCWHECDLFSARLLVS